MLLFLALGDLYSYTSSYRKALDNDYLRKEILLIICGLAQVTFHTTLGLADNLFLIILNQVVKIHTLESNRTAIQVKLSYLKQFTYPH